MPRGFLFFYWNIHILRYWSLRLPSFKGIWWCLLKIGNWIKNVSHKYMFERRCNQIKRARLLHQKAHVNTSLNDYYFSVWIQTEPDRRGLDSDTSAEKTHLARQTMSYSFSRTPVNINICNKAKLVHANVGLNMYAIYEMVCDVYRDMIFLVLSTSLARNAEVREDMHMALFRVRDGFSSAQVSEIFHETLGEWKIGDEFRCFVQF